MYQDEAGWQAARVQSNSLEAQLCLDVEQQKQQHWLQLWPCWLWLLSHSCIALLMQAEAGIEQACMSGQVSSPQW